MHHIQRSVVRDQSSEVDDQRFEMMEPGSSLEKKYRAALVLYAGLAVLSWFTLDARISVGGRLVEMKFIPLIIIGGLALRTVVAMRAEKIREKDSR